MLYYAESARRVIVAGIGKQVKVDINTQKMEYGRYARVYVEVDLLVLVDNEVWIQDHWHKVEIFILFAPHANAMVMCHRNVQKKKKFDQLDPFYLGRHWDYVYIGCVYDIRVGMGLVGVLKGNFLVWDF